MKKIAFITGETGQDGSYLAEFLLSKNYEVHGMVRRSSLEQKLRIDKLFSNKNFHVHYGDMTDTGNVNALVLKIQPDEIYNLAAQSHVKISFEIPEYTANCDALGTLRLLEAIRINGLTKKTKFYQASTSELYGKVKEVPQNEDTPFYPRSPYACAKLYSYTLVVNYREAYGIYACNGILFNHESPRRGDSFVTKKITKSVSEIKLGITNNFSLGNINSYRDWGYAKEYVEGMWLMLQNDIPEDFVLATGKKHSVKEFIEMAFNYVNIEIKWKGSGLNEVGFDPSSGKILVKIDPYYFRPTEVELLLGDPSRAKDKLGWESKTNLKELVHLMMESDLSELKK